MNNHNKDNSNNNDSSFQNDKDNDKTIIFNSKEVTSDENTQTQKKRNINTVLGVVAIVLAVLVLCTILLGIFLIKSIYTKPVVDNDGFLPSGENSTGESDVTPTVSGDTDSRKDDFYNFIVVGKDKGGLNTDVIMIVSFDVKSGNVSVMQIPRDTYVSLDGRSYKINALLSKYYNQAYRDGEEGSYYVAGIKGLASVISSNLNITLDYYVLVNLEGFKNIIDILGGVTMYVPRDMYYEDPYQDLYIDLKEGWQTLNGDKSEQFVRFRKGYAMGDIGRVDAQKLFLSALFKSFKDNISLDKIPAIVEEAIENVTTNLSISDIIYFANKLLGIDMGSMTFLTLPGEGAYSEGTSGVSYYVIHKQAVFETVKKHFHVYNNELTIDKFDKQKVFTWESNAYINDVYNKDYEESETSVKSADELYKK